MLLRIAVVLMMVLMMDRSAVPADLDQPIFFTTLKAGKVPFEHGPHLQRLDNNCAACHNNIYHVLRKNNPTRTMADMEKGLSCGACHKKAANRVKLNDCSKCHPAGDVTISTPNFGSLVFSHRKHLEIYTCGDCHDSLFKTDRTENPRVSMAMMERGKSCGACHDGTTAFSVKGDCVKCHQPRDIPMAGTSLFSHKLHLDISFTCNDCHKGLFDPGPNRTHATMQDMEKGKSCGACHDGKSAFSVKGDCQKCHKNVGDVQFSAFNGRFSHPAHTAMYACGDCHSSVFIGGARSVRHSMAQMEQGTSCGACHDGKTAFTVSSNCDKCHPGQIGDVSFQVPAAGLVGFSHVKHRSLYACGDCHNRIFTTGLSAKRYSMKEMGQGKSCGACHNGTTAFGVNKNCSRCHPVKDVLFSDDARFSHERHLNLHTCSDCHNGLYKAGPGNPRVPMAQMEQGNSCGACHDGSTAFSVTGSCDKCHKSTVTVTYNVRETGATPFVHQSHTALFSCTDCHNSIFKTGGMRRHFTMAEMEKGLGCGACHDGTSAFGVKDNCTRCHPVKKITFRPGGAVFDHRVHVAAYSCRDCHPSRFLPGPGNKPATMALMEKGQSCGACHDDSTAFGVKGNCQKCHPGTPARIRYELPATAGNVEFHHKPHSDKGYNCNDCHYKIIPSGSSTRRWTMKEMDGGNFCGACHGFSMAFSVKDPQSCERCHQKEDNWRPQPLQ